MPQDTPRLPFEIADTIDPTLVTGRAGVPLVIELFRQLGVAATIDAQVLVKQRQRGLQPSQLLESLIALWTSGGDRCQDLTTLREDHALAQLLGYPLPAATTVRDFLEAFHVEDGPLWSAGPQATIPLESAPLAALGQANRALVAALQKGARKRGRREVMKVINKGLASRRAVSRNSGDTIRNSEVMGDQVILKTACLGKRQALVPRKEVPDILWAPGA